MTERHYSQLVKNVSSRFGTGVWLWAARQERIIFQLSFDKRQLPMMTVNPATFSTKIYRIISLKNDN